MTTIAYGHQIWQAGTSTGFGSDETNQAGDGGVTLSNSSDKLKHHSAYGHQTLQDGSLI